MTEKENQKSIILPKEIEMYLQMVKKNNNQINNLSMENDEYLNEIKLIIERVSRKDNGWETTIIDSGMTVGEFLPEDCELV